MFILHSRKKMHKQFFLKILVRERSWPVRSYGGIIFSIHVLTLCCLFYSLYLRERIVGYQKNKRTDRPVISGAKLRHYCTNNETFHVFKPWCFVSSSSSSSSNCKWLKATPHHPYAGYSTYIRNTDTGRVDAFGFGTPAPFKVLLHVASSICVCVMFIQILSLESYI